MSSRSFVKYISTFNFCLPFIGFQLVTTLFLPNSGTADLDVDSLEITRNVTIPYRLFALLVSSLVILLNYKNKIPKNKGIICFFLFWALLIFRIIYDLQIRIDMPVNISQQRTLWMYIFFICLIPTVSVAKSFNNIDFRLAFKIVIVGYSLLIPVFYINNPLLFSDIDIGRIGGNMAMSTIAFGHFGVSLALLALFLFSRSSSKVIKLIAIALFLTGVFVMFRAASRGPLVAWLFTVFFYSVARKRTITKSLIILIVLLFVLYFSWDILLGWISEISPTMVKRIMEEDTVRVTSGRDSFYGRSLHYILMNPITGYAFAVVNNGSYYYSHNMILDAFLALGLFGGFLFIFMLYKAMSYSFYILKIKSPDSWIVLICIQTIIAGQFSSAFYLSDLLNVLLATIFVLYKCNVNKKEISNNVI